MSENSQKLGNAIWISKFSKYTGINTKIISSIIEYSGGIENFYEMNEKTIMELIGGPPEKLSKAKMFFKESENRKLSLSDGDKYSKMGIQAISMIDLIYPNNLKSISAPPAILYICGDNYLKILKQNYCVAIVGTRNPSPYGEAVTQKFVKELAQKDVVIISGMARGIDSLAHKITLDNKGMTIAVLGCGLDITYPPENTDLMRNIIKEGLLISELSPGTPPMKSMFPARNRIISGLADAVAIMEASKKSGTMITAGYAGDQGKDLFAVPGSIFSPNSTGTNQLIQDGACVLTNIEDMLWKLPMKSIQNYMEPILLDPNITKFTSNDLENQAHLSINIKNIDHNNIPNYENIHNNDLEGKKYFEKDFENFKNDITISEKVNEIAKEGKIIAEKVNENAKDGKAISEKVYENAKEGKTIWEKGYENARGGKTISEKEFENLQDVKKIRKILLHTEKTVDEIAQKLDISVAKTLEMLSYLELSGEIILRNGRFSLTDSYK